jgi:reverse gyrase
MAKTYKISRKLGNGELVYVASRSGREQADLLVEWLARHWPGVYEVEEAAPNMETNSASDTCGTQNQRNVRYGTDTS